MADEKTVCFPGFENVSTGERAEGREGEDVSAEMETREPQGGLLAVGNFNDRMDVTTDVESIIRGILLFMDDSDACDFKVIHLI